MSSIALYNALVAAGVDKQLANEAANDVAQSEQVATKLDMANMQTSLANMETRLIKWMFGINLGVVGLAVAILKLT
ncbi:MAG: hypothetical protein OXI88_04725 [Gammaproteobacteria bacterium]|nr:hypothetical protein [Gammaproteobacteria bacterium]MDE0285263.1 hypothetical protein [Gammaproteobacteria bacterium]MDE0511068.1 hypothetical protein [Gammaproteobacteria bacterium]